MSFHWISDAPRSDPFRSGDFPTRADAEAWLVASYEELAYDGVDEVSLMEDDHLVYGPMSLGD